MKGPIKVLANMFAVPIVELSNRPASPIASPLSAGSMKNVFERTRSAEEPGRTDATVLERKTRVNRGATRF